MMFSLFKAITILTLISSSISFVFSENLIEFGKYFLFFTVLQVICYNIYLKFLEIIAEKIKNERIKEYSKQGMEVKCPCYLEKKMFVPIELNAKNTFSCGECQKNIAVDITAKTFMETEMIDLDSADAALVEIYKKLKVDQE